MSEPITPRFLTGTLTALILAGLLQVPTSGARADRPNVVVILIDCLRADHLGCYGYGEGTSPRIDAFAEDAILFEEARSPASWTKPTIPSLFTGKYPIQHRVFTGSKADGPGSITSDVLSAEHVTLAEVFDAFGYATGGFIHNAQISGFMGFDQGFDIYSEELGEADNITRTFFDWLDQNRDGPFFAYVHYLDPHWPYTPPAKWRTPLPAGAALDLDNANWKFLSKQLDDGYLSLGEADLTALITRYDDEIRYTDSSVGTLFDGLAARGLADDTVVIVTADHGEEFFDHGQLEHGNSLYEELVRVPLIVRVPGGESRRVSERVSLIDILPTLCDLIGVPTPADVSGKSLISVLGGSALPERPLFGDHRAKGDRGQLLLSVISGDYKLVRAFSPVTDTAPEVPASRQRPTIQAGQRLEVDGAVLRPGRFLAMEVELIESQDYVKVSSTVQGLSADGRSFELMGRRCRLRPGCKFKDASLEYVSGVTLTEGLWVQAKGRFNSAEVLQVSRIKLLPDEKHEEEIQAPVEGVQVRGKGQLLTMIGLEVEIDGDTEFEGTWPDLTGGSHASPVDVGPSSTPGNLVTRVQTAIELYDLEEDPQERDNIAARRPDVVAELSAIIDHWVREHESRQIAEGAEIELDEATLERLRALGYLK